MSCKFVLGFSLLPVRNDHRHLAQLYTIVNLFETIQSFDIRFN